MPARLFRRIQTYFSRLNKTVLLAATVTVLVIAGVSFVFAAAPTSAPTTDYSAYINNFTTSADGTIISGITGGTAQNSTSNSDVSGLVFTVNLAINATGDDIKTHWDNVAIDPNSFLIKLCDNNSPNSCWLNSVFYEPKSEPGAQSAIYNWDSSDNYADTASATFSTFTTTGNGVYAYNPSTNIANQIGSLTLVKGASLTASLWYCAAGAGATAPKTSTSPTTFGTLCNGASYFQVGAPLPVSIPTTTTALQQQTAASTQALATKPAATNTTDSLLPECGIIGSGTINGCAAQLAYGVYQLTAWVAGLFGELFDFFIGYSVSSASYSYPFVVTGWKLVRDISNIFFILIMVWTGFSAVFNTSKASMKSVVPNLIINALLINFSLFATRVVIDITNISARIFYSEMLVCKQTDLVNGVCPPAKALTGTGGYWPLSVKIVSSFNPQDMFKPSILNPATNAATDPAQSTAASTANTVAVEHARDVADYFAIVSLLAAGIMIMIAIMFFKVSFLFLGRVVGLYICMIFSPFAFLSRGIPAFNKIQRFKWDDWAGELTSYALMAPIFIFFLYIIYTFLSSNFVQQIGVQALASSGFFATVMSIGIPMLIIYFLLTAAQKAAEGLSGEIGKYIQKTGEQVTGFVAGAAVGVATGGASLAGTSAAGLFKLSGETRTNLEARKAAGGFSGQMAALQLKTSDWTQKQTFDARNTKGMQLLNKSFGMNPNNAVVTGLGFGSDRTKGGREGQIKRAEDKTKKEINSVKSDVKDPEAASYWEKHVQTPKMQKRLEKEAEALYMKEHKRAVTDKNSPEFQKEKDNALKAYGKVSNNKQLTQALRTEYAGTILNKSTFSNITGSMGAGGVASVAAGSIAAGLGILPGAALALGGATDQTGQDNAAKAFLGAQAKSVKKKPRSEKLEEESKSITKELEKIEKTLDDTYKTIAKNQINNDPAHASKSQAEKQTLIDAEVVRLKNDEAAGAAAINKHRDALQNSFDEIDLDVKRIDEEYKEAIKSGNTILAGAKKKQRADAIAERNSKKVEYDDLNPKRKQDKESQLNKVDGEIDKIKDKEKSDEGKTAEKKDDKK